MPILHMIIHQIDKKPDGTPSVLHISDKAMVESQANEDLLHKLNTTYNAKPGKGWGFFHAESGAHPFSGWLKQYMAGQDFTTFSQIAVEHLQKLMEESNLSTGGHILFAHYLQGMTDYLTIAVMQHSDAVTVGEDLNVSRIRRLDMDSIFLAARFNLSEWKNNPASKQYVSFLKAKKGRRITEYFRDFIGVQEGVDGPGETRTLLKAFSDFVESEDLGEDAAREKTNTLVSYAMAQAKLGEPITLDELSEVLDDNQPKAFAEFIQGKDYGLSASLPSDKKTLNNFRRFTGRVNGLSISFEQHLLGSKVEFDEAGGTLTLRGLPTQLTDQLRHAVA